MEMGGFGMMAKRRWTAWNSMLAGKKRSWSAFCKQRTTRYLRAASFKTFAVKMIGKGCGMERFWRFLLVSVLLVIPVLSTGCAEHRRAYVWGPGETTYYVQWEHDTHRNHVDWGARSESEHNAYWKWRHHHHDHD